MTPLDARDATAPVPQSFSITTYPNPFNSSVRIDYELPHASDARVSIYNTLGEEVTTLFDGRANAGTHTLSWSPNAASGVYFVKLFLTISYPARKYCMFDNSPRLIRRVSRRDYFLCWFACLLLTTACFSQPAEGPFHLYTDYSSAIVGEPVFYIRSQTTAKLFYLKRLGNQREFIYRDYILPWRQFSSDEQVQFAVDQYSVLRDVKADHDYWAAEVYFSSVDLRYYFGNTTLERANLGRWYLFVIRWDWRGTHTDSCLAWQRHLECYYSCIWNWSRWCSFQILRLDQKLRTWVSGNLASAVRHDPCSPSIHIRSMPYYCGLLCGH
ncbi:MAG: T9SS type A sorting domain-containing protein [bacterium]|nr:T9SS type A sorting domain-containing protein [bacterium]